MPGCGSTTPARMLQKESGGGSNVFGHDPTIFVGAGTVTRAKYLEYKRQRVASGNTLMQGVGPTPADLLDAAGPGGRAGRLLEARGSTCASASSTWPTTSRATARRTARAATTARATPRSPTARTCSPRRRSGAAVLDGAAPVVVPAADGPLKLGSRGPQVVRLTRRLSRLRSKAGTPYLDKPRKKLDATAETALKSFQHEHRLRARRRLRPAQPAQAQPRPAAPGQAQEGARSRRPATPAPADAGQAPRR